MQSVRSAYTSRRWLPFVVDAVLVVVFAALGRQSHAEALSPGEILGTALPFLGALVLGWVIVLVAQLVPSRMWPAGVIVWIVTVSSGLALRVLSGDTAQVPFIIVTTLVLAAFLLLPRLILHDRRVVAEDGPSES